MFVSLVAMFNKEIGGIKELYLNHPHLRNAWLLYLSLVGVQFLHGLLRWQSVQSSLLGALVYLGPVVGLLVAFGFANSEKNILRFIKFYLIITIPAVATVYLSERFSLDWIVLREIGSFVGRELIIYDVGMALKSYSGIFRVGEITAWHAATACMFLILLSTRKLSIIKLICIGMLIVVLVGAIILTGRRKMLMTLTIYIIVHWFLVSIFLKSAIKQAISVAAIGAMGMFALSNLEESSTTVIYLERGKTVYEEVGDRFTTSLNLTRSAINRSAGIGLGVGVSSQGGAYIGSSGRRPSLGGVGEAGAGKIALELGIPGIVLLVYLVGWVIYRIYGNFGKLAKVDNSLLIYSISFSAFLFANSATFFVATQVYGDLYILVILGIVSGMLFSINAKGMTIYRQRKIAHQKSQRFEYHNRLQTGN
jgi:hypothetical protein